MKELDELQATLAGMPGALNKLETKNLEKVLKNEQIFKSQKDSFIKNAKESGFIDLKKSSRSGKGSQGIVQASSKEKPTYCLITR